MPSFGQKPVGRWPVHATTASGLTDNVSPSSTERRAVRLAVAMTTQAAVPPGEVWAACAVEVGPPDGGEVWAAKLPAAPAAATSGGVAAKPLAALAAKLLSSSPSSGCRPKTVTTREVWRLTPLEVWRLRRLKLRRLTPPDVAAAAPPEVAAANAA